MHYFEFIHRIFLLTLSPPHLTLFKMGKVARIAVRASLFRLPFERARAARAWFVTRARAYSLFVFIDKFAYVFQRRESRHPPDPLDRYDPSTAHSRRAGGAQCHQGVPHGEPARAAACSFEAPAHIKSCPIMNLQLFENLSP